MTFEKKPEVLAPAGTLETVQAVFDAGADAVYLGGKQFNMRMHRASYNLTDDEIAQAVGLARRRGRKVYYVLNNLLHESELPAVRDVLTWLAELAPDALIVQDLGTAALARELCVAVPLHASTMLNVHSAESAEALKLMGFTRVITSRDIPLHEVRRIGERSGLEMEYFVHGDLCVAQSAQCYLSGVLFGESSNRGRCMKPCRWQWELIDAEGQPVRTGHLLARTDMCLLPHIPALVQNRIASLKIEGRMRTSEFLTEIVALYRRAVDGYFDDPAHWTPAPEDLAALEKRKVRGFTTSHAFGRPGAAGIDETGQREPRFFSTKAPPVRLTPAPDAPAKPMPAVPELVVHVGDTASAEAALESRADAVYIGGDTFHGQDPPTVEWMGEFADRCLAASVRPGVLSPRICDERDLAEWAWWLEQLEGIDGLTIGVSRLGAIEAARLRPGWDVLADFALNTCNSVSADELSTMGASRVTASVELDAAALKAFVSACRVPVEVIAQGPVAGMIIEDCIETFGQADECHGQCPPDGPAVLRDASGQTFRTYTDRRCRTHVLTPTDTCVLPNLAAVAQTQPAGLRIEAQWDAPAVVTVLTRTYREALDALQAGSAFDDDDAIEQIQTAAGRTMSDGALAFRRSAAALKGSPHARR